MGNAGAKSSSAAGEGMLRPSLSEILSMTVRDGLPVFGVFFLGWEAISVIFLYWFDGLLSLLAIIVPAVFTLDREDPKLLAKYQGPKRVLLLASILFFACLFVAVMMVVPGAMIWSQAAKHGLDPLGTLLNSRSTLAFAGIIALVYLVSTTLARLRGLPSGDRLTTQERGNLVFHRAIVAGMLSFIVIGGWTLKIFTVVTAALFAISELYPERYLRLLGMRKTKGEREERKPDRP